MKNCRRASPTVRPDVSVVSTLATVLALVVFGIVELTSLNIAAAAFYGVVVLLVASAGNRPATIIAAWGCVALTLLGFAMPPPTACCDRVQLQQVLINLIMNSVQAMAGVSGPRRLRLATRRFDDEHAQVIVQDSGPGISEENSSRLFNTFFTTKAEGMGMGLSFCRSIVEAHGGRIWAESPAAGGAVLQFILPVDEGRCHEQ